MDVYQLRGDYGKYRDLLVRFPFVTDFADRFDGAPMKRPWSDVRLEWDPDSESPKPDFNELFPVPTFNSRAMDALRDLLEGHGEILPTTCEGEQLYFFNVTRVIDALDEASSRVDRYLGRNEISTVDGYVFFAEKLTSVVIFKIPFFGARVFVTDPFVERVKSTELTGFWLPRVWSTDKTAIIDNVP
jgi:hypothetical protein